MMEGIVVRKPRVSAMILSVVTGLLVLNLSGCDALGMTSGAGITPGMGLSYQGETTPLDQFFLTEVGTTRYPDSDVDVFEVVLAPNELDYNDLNPSQLTSGRYLRLEMAFESDAVTEGTYEFSDWLPEVAPGTFGGALGSYVAFADPTSERFTDSISYIIDGRVTIEISGDEYTISGTVETDSSVGIGVAEFSYQGPLTETID